MQNNNLHIDTKNSKNTNLLVRLYQLGIQSSNYSDFFTNFSKLLGEFFDFDAFLVVEKSPEIDKFEVIYTESNTSDILPLVTSIIENNINEQNRNNIEFIKTENINPQKSIVIINIEREEPHKFYLVFIENSSVKGFSNQDEKLLVLIADKISSVINKLVFGNAVNFQQKIQNILEFVYDFAIIFDNNGIVLYSNQIAKEKLSLSDDEVYTIGGLFDNTIHITDFIDSSPNNTKEVYTELISVFGKYYPARILLQKFKLNNQEMIFAICKDIKEEEYYRNSEIRNSADNLLFKIIADFILDLLGKDDIKSAMLSFLPDFAKLLFADRVFLAKLNSSTPDNNFDVLVGYNIAFKKAEINANLYTKSFTIPENSPIMELFLEHKPVKSVISECPDELLSYFEKYNFKSIHAVPIFANKHLTALFGVIDNTEERQWTGNEANALIIIGNAIAASLERKETFKQLVIAREAAEEAYKSKSNFLSCMSHEIRTPLNGIIGMAELLHMTSIDNEQLEFIDTIQDSANNLVDVVNDILDLSKIDSGSLQLENKTFNFRDLIKKTVYTISTEAFKKNIELIVDIDNKIPAELIGDSLRYRQVLINIIGNAVKYTLAGEILIQVEMNLLQNNKIEILTCIKDTGIGIAKDKLDYIFESFAKADYSTANTNRGTGLGLAISKKIIELMGGTISASSELGKGSTFNFKTYFSIADIIAIDYSDNYSIKPGFKLLIIENNLTSRSILTKYLEEFTDNITTIEKSDLVFENIKSLNSNNYYDSIIIDDSINNNNAIEFISDLRDIEADRTQNVILMLSKDLSQLEKEFADNNNVNCIHKPIFPEDLYNFLSNTVSIKHKSKNENMKIDQIETEIPKSSNEFTVLVAEDNLFNLKLSITLLKKKNWNIISAENGLEAVQKYKENKIDLVLLDIQMPEMNGYEAAKLIREEQQKTQHFAPIIALTAYAMKGDREKALCSGMDEYMAKPLEPNKFYDIINSQIIKYKNKSNPHFLFEELVKRFSNDPYALRTHIEKSIIHLREYTTELNDFFNLRDFDNIAKSSISITEQIGEDYFPFINNAINELLENITKKDLEAINSSKNLLIDEVARFIIYYKDTIMRKFE
jgi:signal transduction histidine kinase/DNA-binding response OmpR family regulator